VTSTLKDNAEVAALLVRTPAYAIDEINTKRLRDAVTVSGILGHERALQRIANQNGGPARPGHLASPDGTAPSSTPSPASRPSLSRSHRSSRSSPRARI
jgi:hypothetical protein